MENSNLPTVPEPNENKNVGAETAPQENPAILQKKLMNPGLAAVLRILFVLGGLFIVFVIGLGLSFSSCFTIKGPPPPECAPVQFVTLILMPAASLLFLIPLSKKIK